MLVSCVLHTATTKAQADNSFFGGAIGMSVTSLRISLVTSVDVTDPAVGIGLPVIHDVADHCWIHVLGLYVIVFALSPSLSLSHTNTKQFMGAMFAVLIFSLTAEDNEHEISKLIPQIGKI